MLVSSGGRTGSGMSISLMALEYLQALEEGKVVKYNYEIGKSVPFTKEDFLKEIEEMENFVKLSKNDHEKVI